AARRRGWRWGRRSGPRRRWWRAGWRAGGRAGWRAGGRAGWRARLARRGAGDQADRLVGVLVAERVDQVVTALGDGRVHLPRVVLVQLAQSGRLPRIGRHRRLRLGPTRDGPVPAASLRLDDRPVD